MRILGIEITKTPKPSKDIWSRAALAPMGLLISAMTPDELRRELTWVARELMKGNFLYSGINDPFKRVQSKPLNYGNGDRK
jgi:hypothetical protein